MTINQCPNRKVRNAQNAKWFLIILTILTIIIYYWLTMHNLIVTLCSQSVNIIGTYYSQLFKMIVSNNKPATKRKTNIAYKLAEGLFIWGELARLSGLAHLGDMNFIPRCYGIFCLSSVKKLVMSLEKNCLMKHVLMGNCSYTNYLINIWKKKNWLKKTLSYLARLAHLGVFKWKIFILPTWNLGKIKWFPT